MDGRFDVNEAASAAEVVEYGGVSRRFIGRKGGQERCTLCHLLLSSVKVIALEDALLNADTKGLEQADAGSRFVTLEGLVEAAHVRSLSLSNPRQQAGLKQAVGKGCTAMLSEAHRRGRGFVLFDEAVFDQTDGSTAGDRLIRPSTRFENGRHLPRRVRCGPHHDGEPSFRIRQGWGGHALGSRDAAFNPSEARVTLPRLPTAASHSRDR